MNSDEINKYKAALLKASDKIKELDLELKKAKENEEIAVIGYHCRFPGGANNSQIFWEKLQKGFSAVSEIKADRFEVASCYAPGNNEKGKTYTRYASVLDSDIRAFDNLHFEISAVEAISIDPQQRLLLEVSWEALERSGLDIASLKGSKTGVFVGIDGVDYLNREIFSGDLDDIGTYSLFGVTSHSAAGRLSYFYDFRGSAVCVNTACSSSLAAMSVAIDQLKSCQCDMAVVGGANLILNPSAFVGLSQMQAISPDGCCKTFDASADGFGRGEGCGVVILKRAKDAKKDGNCIEALIRGVAIGQDGKSNGFYAPNGLAEQSVIAAAIKKAGLSENDIDYIEAHGTGTTLGDFIEAQAICEVFKNRKTPILIGSVKSNIGHLEAAAGMASFIKVLLSLKHKQLPPSIHFKTPNPNIDWTKVKVVDQMTDWVPGRGKRRAGINTFGISGTLVHLILEEPDVQDEDLEKPVLPENMITISTKNKNSLLKSIVQIRDYIRTSENELYEIAYSTNIVKAKNEYRFAIVGSSKEQILKEIDLITENEEARKLVTGKGSRNKGKIAFLFTGQGSLYLNAAKEFYERSSNFRTEFDRCDVRFKELLGVSVKETLFGTDEDKLTQAAYSQPIIFSLEYSLVKMWDDLNITPDYVIGHSVGEYAALCYSKVLTFEDASKMIATRSAVMSSVSPTGKMAGVLVDEYTMREAIAESGCEHVSLAAINAPKNVTISGLRDEVDQVIELLHRKSRVFVNDLGIHYPYHSIVMKDYKDIYGDSLDNVKYGKPDAKVISTVTGKLEPVRTFKDKTYWATHLESTVAFKKAMEQAEELGVTVFIEIGGTATLCGLAGQCIKSENAVFVPSLRNGISGYKQFLESLKQLYLAGLNLDFSSFHQNYKNRKIDLPDYPFEKKVFWKEAHKDMRHEETILSGAEGLERLNHLLNMQNEQMAMQKSILQQLSGEI